jgi:hypothetical protein
MILIVKIVTGMAGAQRCDLPERNQRLRPQRFHGCCRRGDDGSCQRLHLFSDGMHPVAGIINVKTSAGLLEKLPTAFLVVTVTDFSE